MSDSINTYYNSVFDQKGGFHQSMDVMQKSWVNLNGDNDDEWGGDDSFAF